MRSKRSFTGWAAMKTWAAISALLALVVLTVPASAQVIVGAGGSSTFLFKGNDTVALGEVIGQFGARFDIAHDQQGQVDLIFGSAVNQGGGKVGGLLYHHFFDFISGNQTLPGITVGGFILDNSDVSELSQATMFLGGGLCLDIKTDPDPAVNDGFLAFVEVYPSFRSADVDEDPAIVRVGMAARFN